MANRLKNIFTSGSDEIVQDFIIESWHVSQSVDAFTGEEAYDIEISGSLVVSGSVALNGTPNSSGGGYSTLVINDTTGQIYYTGSYGSSIPAPPDRSLQFNDNGDWGGANLFYLTASGKYTTDENYTPSLINLIGVPAVGGVTSILSWGQNESQGWLTNASSETGSIVIGHPGNASGRIGGIFISNDNLATPNIYVSASDQIGLHLNYTGISPIFTKDVQIGEAASTASTEVYGDFYLPVIPNTVTTNIVGFDTTTGKLSYYNTGSFGGGGGTPAGTSSMVQYNNLGAFAGDAGFTYASASQVLTIDKSTTITSALPNLRLLGNSSTAGALSGVIAGSATIANTAPASIQFRNAVSHGLGNYDTDVLIKTAYAGGGGTTVERTALAASASGDVYFGYDVFAPNLDNTSQSNVVGFNSSTGQLTYFTTPSGTGVNLTRPGSPDQTIDFDEINVSDNEIWDFATGGGAPSSTQFTTNNASPASITQFNINETSGLTGNLSAKFATICSGGTLTIGDDNNPANTATYTVRQVIDQGSYYTIYVSNYAGSGLGTLSAGNAYRIGFDTDKQVVLDDQNYNRILIKNSTGSTKTVRFKANSAASAGDYYYVEITSNTGNADNMLLAYVFYTTGTTTTLTENNSAIYYNPNGTANTQLNINTATQQAVMEFRVTPSGDLALLGGDKVIR